MDNFGAINEEDFPLIDEVEVSPGETIEEAAA